MPNSETQSTVTTTDVEDGQTIGTDLGGKPVLTEIELYRPDDVDEWRATQPEIEIVGEGDLAARAVEDYARQVAEAKEAGQI
jgi:hypothetical protein